MINRPYYIKILKKYKDIPLVKILAGIRRCGKSTILEMLKEELEKTVPPDHIISLSFTSEDFDSGMTDKELYKLIKDKMNGHDRHYLLLDEIQEINCWEKAVNSLLENENTDIYATWSNSRLTAGEISIYLSGRYILIPVFTLSFREYIDFKRDRGISKEKLLMDYIRQGGFPVIASCDFDERSAYQIAEGIYNSVISNDIARRHNIANYELFNRVVRYIVENVGRTFSANSIVKFLKGEGRSLTVETVYNYIEWLENAFIIYRCRRYDLQRKSVLKTQEKFYLADPSLKYCVMGFDPKSIAAMLEIIVYFELLRKGYSVYIGKTPQRK